MKQMKVSPTEGGRLKKLKTKETLTGFYKYSLPEGNKRSIEIH